MLYVIVLLISCGNMLILSTLSQHGSSLSKYGEIQIEVYKFCHKIIFSFYVFLKGIVIPLMSVIFVHAYIQRDLVKE